MPSRKPQIGECWTVREEQFAEGKLIKPGDIGIIGAINCPNIWHAGTFTCIDFIFDDKTYRARLNNKYIKYMPGVVRPETATHFCGVWANWKTRNV